MTCIFLHSSTGGEDANNAVADPPYIIYPRKRQWPDAGSFPVMRRGLFWCSHHDRSKCHHVGGKARNGDSNPKKVKRAKNVHNFLFSLYGLYYLWSFCLYTRFALFVGLGF